MTEQQCDCACFHCTRGDHYYCPREMGCSAYPVLDDEDDEQLRLMHAPEIGAQAEQRRLVCKNCEQAIPANSASAPERCPRCSEANIRGYQWFLTVEVAR